MSWIDEAAALPVAFAQVREDPLLDLDVVEAAGAPARVVMVASGGCTAAFLAASGKVAALTLVDPNAAQLALTERKLALLSRPPAERLAALGHRPHDENGDDYRGRYERVFAAFRARLGHREALLALALKPNLAVQHDLLVSALFGGEPAMRVAFAEAFRQRTLVRLFGEGATANRAVDFDEHFFDRTMRAVARWTIAENPWLAQLLVGRFGRAVYPWLDAPATMSLPPVETKNAGMLAALAGMEPRSADVVHLSNILDWLDPGAAEAPISAAARVLRPGGVVIVRQLNSTLAASSFAERIEWDDAWGARLLAADRSFFYRAIHVGCAR